MKTVTIPTDLAIAISQALATMQAGQTARMLIALTDIIAASQEQDNQGS